MTNLEKVLKQAVIECSSEYEEEGGIIMYLAKDDAYKYIKLSNTNTNTPIAPVLWTADRDEYAKQVIPLFKEGWRQFASFHTHPQFIPYPSSIDLRDLFPGFSTNFIFSQSTQEITRWDYEHLGKSFVLGDSYHLNDGELELMPVEDYIQELNDMLDNDELAKA